jgi:hypothetical protein
MASYLLVRGSAWAGSDGTFSEPPLPHSLDLLSPWIIIKKLVWNYVTYIYDKFICVTKDCFFLQKISVSAHVHSINAGSTIRAAHLDMFMFSLWLYIGSCI